MRRPFCRSASASARAPPSPIPLNCARSVSVAFSPLELSQAYVEGKESEATVLLQCRSQRSPTSLTDAIVLSQRCQCGIKKPWLQPQTYVKVDRREAAVSLESGRQGSSSSFTDATVLHQSVSAPFQTPTAAIVADVRPDSGVRGCGSAPMPLPMRARHSRRCDCSEAIPSANGIYVTTAAYVRKGRGV